MTLTGMVNVELRRVASRILEHELRQARAARSGGAIESACDLFQRHIDRSIGLRGFQALLGRAIYLTRQEYPWLESVSVAVGNGCAIRGAAQAAEAAGSENAALEGFAAVLANIMWLLGTLIGGDLAIRFVTGTWPDLKLDVATLKKELGDD